MAAAASYIGQNISALSRKLFERRNLKGIFFSVLIGSFSGMLKDNLQPGPKVSLNNAWVIVPRGNRIEIPLKLKVCISDILFHQSLSGILLTREDYLN